MSKKKMHNRPWVNPKAIFKLIKRFKRRNGKQKKAFMQRSFEREMREGKGITRKRTSQWVWF